jgi:hypothetical protein
MILSQREPNADAKKKKKKLQMMDGLILKQLHSTINRV